MLLPIDANPVSPTFIVPTKPAAFSPLFVISTARAPILSLACSTSSPKSSKPTFSKRLPKPLINLPVNPKAL